MPDTTQPNPMPAALPLTGITVVDLTRVLAGPACTQMLADLGARVIKVEQPGGGDDARSIGPFIDGVSAYFLSVNRNKESIALDLKEAQDRAIFERLLEHADVLIENFRPGTLEKLHYSWEQLHTRYPRLILCSISGFGQTGPHHHQPAYDMVVQAMSGMMSVTGHSAETPCRVGVSIGDLAAGLYSVIGVQSALLRRMQTQQGERLDISMLDCQVALLENAVARLEATGSVPHPIGTRHPSMAPFDIFQAQDGCFVIAVGNDRAFVRLCEILDLPALAQDARFANNSARCQYHEALKPLLEQRLQQAPRAHWIGLLEQSGVPTGLYQTVAEMVTHPQVQARQMLTEVTTPTGTPLRVASNPLLNTSGQKVVRCSPPALDADRMAILQELGLLPATTTLTTA